MTATSQGTAGTLSADGSTEVFIGRNISEMCVFSGDYSGGYIELEISHNDGSTWIKTGDVFDDNVAFELKAPKGKYRFTLFNSIAPTVNYYISVNEA